MFYDANLSSFTYCRIANPCVFICVLGCMDSSFNAHVGYLESVSLCLITIFYTITSHFVAFCYIPALLSLLVKLLFIEYN